MTAIVNFVPAPSDDEIAADLKRRMKEAHQLVLAILDEASAHGMQINCSTAMGTLSKHIIVSLQVAKVF